ncbi:MAG: helix-turn-helix domain-containing protein [Deltaproteobacteria bacterium]|nr:helix-turn-helix domain-containing protein [Deltaproteobacteria bacterium]
MSNKEEMSKNRKNVESTGKANSKPKEQAKPKADTPQNVKSRKSTGKATSEPKKQAKRKGDTIQNDHVEKVQEIDPNTLIPLKKAAALIGYAVSTVFNKRKKGELPFKLIKRNRRNYIKQGDLIEYINSVGTNDEDE